MSRRSLQPRIGLLTLVCIVFLSGIITPQITSAQPFIGGNGVNQDFGTPLSSTDSNLLPPGPTSPTEVGRGGAAGTEASPGKIADDLGVGEPTPTETPAVSVGDSIYMYFYYFVVTVFGSLLGLAGSLFSYAIDNFLLGFGEQYFAKNVGFAVESTWTLVRDLFNLTFIFGLVYIGFKMILDSSDSKARSMLISLIGAALLVNFSLFITKFIIDIANVSAVVVSRGFIGLNISNVFLNILSLSTFLNIPAEQIVLMGNGGAFAYIVGIAIFLGTASFVFAAGGILIIVRFVVLNIYLVFSPIMFIGWVFPSMQHHATKFWNGFLGNAFFAPAYMLLLYLSFQVLNQYGITLRGAGGVDYGALFKGGDAKTLGDATAIVPFFVLAMVFMVASLVVAKNMGAVGASTAISIGNKLRGNVQGVMYRNTGGRISKGVLNAMDRSGFSNLPGTRSLRSAVKSGYEYGAGGTSLAKTRSDIKSEKANITENRSRMQGLKDTKAGKGQVALAASGEADLATLRGRDYTTLTDVEKDKLTELESNQAKADKFITGLDKSSIEALSPKERASYSTRFTADQVTKIMESEKISTGEKNEIYGSRVDSISAKIGGSVTNPSQVTKLSRDELDTLGFDWVAKNSQMLTQTQFDDFIKNSKKVTPAVAETLKSRKKNELLSQVMAGTADPILREFQKKPKEFVQLPKELFDVSKSYLGKIYAKIDTGVLEQMGSEKSISPRDRNDLKAYLLNPSRTTGAGGVTKDVKDYLKSDEGKKMFGTTTYG